MKLSGWHRLWIVTVIFYGIAVAFVAFATRPTASGIEWQWINQATDAIAEKITEKEGKEVTSYRAREALFRDKTNPEIISWLKNVAQSPSENQKVFSRVVSEINNKFNNEIELLPGKQRDHYFQSVLWWAIPSICLYLLGWSIGWIIRGFKHNKH